MIIKTKAILKKVTIKAFLKEALITLGLALVIYFLLQFVVQFKPVSGSSMEPTFAEKGDRVIISRVLYLFHEPERGDIITFKPPFKSSRDYIKRVIGLPGETVEIKKGKVYIDGQLLDEPYIIESFTYSEEAVTIPEDFYYVLGDNRDNSSDSHIWGMLPKENIVGKVWFCYWPPSMWGLAPNYSFSS